MAAEELTIAMRLRGARAANAQLRETAGSVDAITRAQLRSEKASARFARGFSSAGATMTRRFTLPIVAGMGFAVKASLDFNEKMELLHTQAGATQAEVKRLTPEVLKFAKVSPKGPNALADSLFRIESHGIRGAAALRAMRASSDLAIVGNENLEEVTYALASALATGIKGTESESKAAATLNAIVGQGSMRMGDLTAALSSGVLPAAKAFGLSLTDVGAALDVMTSRGVPAQAAATRLRTTFSLIAGTKADKMLKSIGLSSSRLVDDFQKPRGLLIAFRELAAHLQGMTRTQKAIFLSRTFGARQSSTILTIIQSLGDLEKRYDGVAAGQKHYNEQVKAAKDQPINKLRTAWSNLQASLIKLGGAITPIVTKLAGALSMIADALAGHPKLGLSILMALAVMGPMLRFGALLYKIYKASVMLRTATFALTAETWGFNAALLANPITWIVVGVAALIVLLIVLQKKFHLVTGAISLLRHHWKLFLEILGGPFVLIITHFKTFLRIVKSIVGWIGKIHVPHIPGSGFLKHVPFMADGGHPATRTTAVVGERGPEIVSLPGGARVHPNEGSGGGFATVPIVLTVDGRTLHDAVYRVERDRQARR